LVYTSTYETLNLTALITFPKHFTEVLLVYKIHKNKIYSQNSVQGHLSSIAVCNQQGFECHLNFCNTGEGISVTANILNLGTVIFKFGDCDLQIPMPHKHLEQPMKTLLPYKSMEIDLVEIDVLVASNVFFYDTSFRELYLSEI
jgi:hypothetical protein